MSYQTFQHNRNFGCRLTKMVLAGYRAVVLENEKLRVTVIADKGADIYEFLYKPRDVDDIPAVEIGQPPMLVRTPAMPTTLEGPSFFICLPDPVPQAEPP